MSSPEKIIHTYHCICTQLVLATTTPLSTLKPRTSDSSLILPLPDLSATTNHYALLTNTTLDTAPTIIRLEDGFEKRYFHKCNRCDLSVGYSLDKSQSEDGKGMKGEVVFLLQGGLVGTENMKAAKDMEGEIGRVGVKG
ncbi:hypothetical protein AUEXF2481DRAFT_24406 [Aureobasidium subglaciale EXF-2481]|uniref:STEEP1 domain-containing protein n=1 Tax=Aureobasidium subglaciale (strain EXF-2481) TaxID=1043005 RepID=A0A074YV60_AURSE|nr:uncharacterized protein AUEXF2481DRAFT_24406 [Aureobasidium subglaciale EXF-2481]KER00045.1 hypothetical protein AUEXF2481DRAFT_24406 [Aureobasidium subglaciale EXF-2481]